jgi:hypothetical protein
MLVFRFQERYILHFFPPKKQRNPYSDYLVLVLQQTLVIFLAVHLSILI